ncbi:helix-turn-helix domain-containing protein [Bacillus cereus group sp. BfR-BA-01321]|nr:helix-turn-helix domain-containing protein [Bacillus cereus group sp. BfR-BA-01321]
MYLQNKLPDKWFIKKNKNKEFKLYKPFDSPIENINFLYFRNTFLFKALDIIMNINVRSNSTLAENLYIQNKKVKIILEEIEGHLNKYNLHLKKRPIRISGNNIDIILMYHKIYLKTYADDEWPFEEIYRGICIELLTEVEKS